MLIRIVKKVQGQEPRQAAPLVEDAPKAKALPTQAELDAVALAYWQEHNVSPDARRRQCAFCEVMSYKPCSAVRSAGCLNFHTTKRRKERKGE